MKYQDAQDRFLYFIDYPPEMLLVPRYNICNARSPDWSGSGYLKL
jgi:hypothetical protein